MNLYRYRAVDEFSINGLEENLFYFTPPPDFNDPFDCQNLFTFEGATDADWSIFLNNFLLSSAPHLSEPERRARVESVIRSGDHRKKEKIAEQAEKWQAVLSNQSKKLGIVCLSKTPDSLPMWSYYGGYHRGFCLQFDEGQLRKPFFCSNVTYSSGYPTFSDFVRADLDEVARLFVLTKSEEYQHEKEVRLIVDGLDENKVNRLIKYPKSALTGVIFGCFCSAENEKIVADALEKNGSEVSFYRCSKSSSAYSLQITPV